MNETSTSLLAYKDYCKEYPFQIGYFLPVSFVDKLGLVSLLGFLSFSVKLKTPQATTFQVVEKILNPNLKEYLKDEHFLYFIYRICILVDDFSTNVKNNKEFELFGLKTQKDIISQINNTLEQGLPF